MAQLGSQDTKKRAQIRMLGADGDSGIAWDPDDAASTALAEEFFAAHAGSVYLAFEDDGGVGHHIPYGDFNPQVHRNVVLVPVPVVG